jgi:predicted permease
VGNWTGELRASVRQFLRGRSTTLVAVLALSLGIGVATALFSVVHAVLLRPLPYPDSERLVRVQPINPKGLRTNSVSEPNFEDLRDGSRSFEALALYSSWPQSVAGGSEPVRAEVAVVSDRFFGVLGVSPRLGRPFSAEDQAPGAIPTALVSHAFWQRALASRADLAGLSLRSGGRSYAVIGVLPPGPGFPVGADVWLPKNQFPRNPSRTANNWRVVGRLRAGVSVEQARHETSALARQLRERHGDDTWMADADVRSLREALTGDARQALLVLFAATGVLLLAAWANVANLLLAQAAGREREFAVRLALGATRGRLLRQLGTETLVLASVGGLLGVAFATVGVRLLLAFEPGRLPRAEEVGSSPAKLLFALAASLATALGVGLFTGWRAVRRASRTALVDGARGAATGTSRRLLDALVASQVAAAATLLVGGGLLGRSLAGLLDVDPGFRTEHRVALDVSLPEADSPEILTERVRFHDEVVARLLALPGVSTVGAVNTPPLAGGGADGAFLATEQPVVDFDAFGRLMKDPAIAGHAEFRVAGPGYLAALGIPLVRGRDFDARDVADAPHVALVSEALVRARFAGVDPIGRRIHFGNMDGDMRPYTIVGVVGDVRDDGLDAPPRPTFYASLRQRPRAFSALSFVAQVDGDPAAFAAAAREVVRALAPELPPRVRTLVSLRDDSLAERRFALLLLAVFAGGALALAALGVYGVAAYTVARRTREMGVRLALGARPAQVLGLVVGQGTRAVAIGGALGLFGAFALGRALSSLLYGVRPADPATVAAVALLLAAAGVAASLVPARRAARLDPARALRDE